MNKTNFTIGCLTLSAIVMLTAIIVATTTTAPQAEASGMVTSSGSYTLLTGKYNTAAELIYLIDSNTDQLLVYRIDPSNRNLILENRLQLEQPQADNPKKGLIP